MFPCCQTSKTFLACFSTTVFFLDWGLLAMKLPAFVAILCSWWGNSNSIRDHIEDSKLQHITCSNLFPLLLSSSLSVGWIILFWHRTPPNFLDIIFFDQMILFPGWLGTHRILPLRYSQATTIYRLSASTLWALCALVGINTSPKKMPWLCGITPPKICISCMILQIELF